MYSWLFPLICCCLVPSLSFAGGVTGSLDLSSFHINLAPLFSVGVLLLGAGGVLSVFYGIAILLGWDPDSKIKAFRDSNVNKSREKRTRYVVHTHKR